MIAQKLRNNKIAIGNVSMRKDAVQTIHNLKTSEFFALVRSARNWDKSLNDTRDIMFTTYENEHYKVCKEFDKIYERRELQESREKAFRELVDTTMKSKQETTADHVVTKETKQKKEELLVQPKKLVNYVSDCIGTSKLVRIPSKQIIKIARRKNERDNINKVNSVCIDNRLRELFFTDCKHSQHFYDTNLYELMYSKEDKLVYEKWDAIMDDIYRIGLSQQKID